MLGTGYEDGVSSGERSFPQHSSLSGKIVASSGSPSCLHLRLKTTKDP